MVGYILDLQAQAGTGWAMWATALQPKLIRGILMQHSHLLQDLPLDLADICCGPQHYHAPSQQGHIGHFYRLISGQ